MSELTSLLARDDVVPVALIEDALQTQVLEGGDLDTALLELAAVPENVLSAYRAASYGLPAAARDQVMSVAPDLISIVPAEIARAYGLVPIGRKGSALILAAWEPPSEEDAKKIADTLGMPVQFHIATSVRVMACLALHYEYEMLGRMRVLVDRLRDRDPGALPPVEHGRDQRAAAVNVRWQGTFERDDEPTVETEVPGSLKRSPVSVAPVVSIDERSGTSASSAALPERMDADAARKRLQSARDRDEVVRIFSAVAARYFDAIALFSVREGRALGLEAYGMDSKLDIRALDLSIEPGGVIDGMCRTLVAEVLEASSSESISTALRRGPAQPSVLIPVCIRRRVVSFMYGDRAGAPVSLGEIDALLRVAPDVGMALERIVRNRKLFALSARHMPAIPPAGSEPPRRTTRSGHPVVSARADNITQSLPMGAIRDSQQIKQPVRRSPAPGRVMGVLGEAGDNFDPQGRPTVQLPDATSSEPAPQPSVPARVGQNGPPSAATKPPPGAGTYNLNDVEAEQVTVRPKAASRPPSRPPTSPPGRPSSRPASAHPSGPPRRRTSQPPDARRDDAGGLVWTEVVSLPPNSPDSLAPPGTLVEPPPSADDIHSQEAVRLIEQLYECGPEEDEPIVQSLVRLGDVGLLLIEHSFPGPLWFDRRQPHSRLPSGRDASPFCRALYAYGERALATISVLMKEEHDDVRFYATLLAAERVHPSLLPALAARVFDPDPQIRTVAADTLVLYRDEEGFLDTLQVLRDKAASDDSRIEERLAAIDALHLLRDEDSVEVLLSLRKSRSKQLSMPARRALTTITAQDFVSATRKWSAWHNKHGHKRRAEWLIDSLMHDDETVRAIAAAELQKLTRVYYGFVASAAKKDRELAQGRYRDWWDKEGKLAGN